MKDKEGALLNHAVAGPQCQENGQIMYEKYDRYNNVEQVRGNVLMRCQDKCGRMA